MNFSRNLVVSFLEFSSNLVYNAYMLRKQLSGEDVRHIAQLTNIQLTDEAVLTYQKQLDETLQYVANLNDIDTEHTKPSSHPNQQQNVVFSDGATNSRLLNVKNATKNAKHVMNDQFVVDKIQ